MSEPTPVTKTYKHYVGGAFIRSESGKTLSVTDAEGRFLANVCRGSRKDLRDAVQVARAAQGKWSARSAFNRGQILYRIAEMLEARRSLFETHIVTLTCCAEAEARRELDVAIGRTFWYAGWPDKLAQVLGCTNPVASPFFNFSLPEPTGVVAILGSRYSPLVGLVSAILPVVLSGNTCVLVADGPSLTLAVELGEVLATSDVPGGVVNLLTGRREELAAHAASHMDVNALAVFGGSAEERRPLQEAAAANIKRVVLFDDPPAAEWLGDDWQSVYWIERFVEWKTAWHPIGV